MPIAIRGEKLHCRYCVGKWREEEREGWDKKMHDVGRVEAMLAAAGKVFQARVAAQPYRMLHVDALELVTARHNSPNSYSWSWRWIASFTL